MVDSGALVGDVLHVRAYPSREHRGGSLNAVAETHRVDAEVVEIARDHAHRVRVIENNRLRAELENVVRYSLEGGRASEEPEDSAGSAGVADDRVNAVFLRDREVGSPRVDCRVVADGDEDGVGSVEGVAAVERGFDFCRVVTLIYRLLYDLLGGEHIVFANRDVDKHYV